MSLTRSKAVLELGKRLVSQLDIEDDLLASWMAHFIAEQIEAAERASDDEKAAAQDRCASAILQIWEHRHSLPDQLRPLKDLDPVLRALASLDVDETDYRYYPEALREADVTTADEAAEKWLRLANGLDYSARLLIQFALRSAAENAAEQAAPWVELALQAGTSDFAERAVVRFVLDDEDSGHASPNERLLRDRLSRLETFARLVDTLATELRSQLHPAGPEDTDTQDT